MEAVPASRIIYVTPQSRGNLATSYHNASQLPADKGKVKVTFGTNYDLKEDKNKIVKQEPSVQTTSFQTTSFQNGTNTNLLCPKTELLEKKDGIGNKMGSTSNNASCQVNTDYPNLDVLKETSTKSVIGTQTNLHNQTIFDEMRRKAGETFRKLDLYQILVGQTEERKSALLPGTDSEYRTPGAHYRNKNGQIKRPMNAFMVWAREFRGKLAAAMPHANNSDISIKLGQVWSSLPPDQKMQYYNIAEKIKVKHRQDFPDWVYKPLPTIKKKDTLPTENNAPYNDPMTSYAKQSNAAPSIPFVNFARGVNRNQSATTTTTRIPVILQPVTYQVCPAVSQTVKDKLVDKISGGGNNQPSVVQERPLVGNGSVPVRKVEVMSVRSQNQTSGPGPEVLRKPPIQTRDPTDHPRLGELLRQSEILQVKPHTVKSEPTPPSTITPTINDDNNTTPIKADTKTIIKDTLKTSTAAATSLRADVHDEKNPTKSISKSRPMEKIQHKPREHNTLKVSSQQQSSDRPKEITRLVSREGVGYIANEAHGTDQRSDTNDTTAHEREDDNMLEGSGACSLLNSIDLPGPMFNDLLDPFDPLMDCDYLYSELYPGCLHLDVSRWREYLDITSDDENDPLSRFQDDSDDDIKISPVPLKETLRRMCNAHVQRSESGDIIVGDLMIPIGNSPINVRIGKDVAHGLDSAEITSAAGNRDSEQCNSHSDNVNKITKNTGQKIVLESSCSEMAYKAGPSTRNGPSLGVC